jgi:hypothetical protein
METPVFRLLTLTILASLVLSSAKSSGQEDPWFVLNKITHKRSYMIETRDRKCVGGVITQVTSDRLTASDSSRSPDLLTFPRADVLRVTSEQTAYYNGRSSWSDVSSLRLTGRERLKIVMKDGKVYKFKPPYTVSDEGITLHPSGRSTKIAKGEIAQVYEIAIKPLTATGEYLMEELGPMIVFDPDWYAYVLHLEQYVTVLVYDSSRSEDNSSAQCIVK